MAKSKKPGAVTSRPRRPRTSRASPRSARALPGSLGHLATRIVQRLQDAGFAAFWVGGCVRDFLLGRDPYEYDIVTSALPDQVEKLFPRTIAVGRKFGVMVVLEKDHQFQVATF